MSDESLEKFLSITSILAKTAKEHSGLNCVVLDYASKEIYPHFFDIKKKYQSPLLKAIAEISDKTDTETARRNLKPIYELLCVCFIFFLFFLPPFFFLLSFRF